MYIYIYIYIRTYVFRTKNVTDWQTDLSALNQGMRARADKHAYASAHILTCVFTNTHTRRPTHTHVRFYQHTYA